MKKKSYLYLQEEINRLQSELKKMTSDYVSLAKECTALVNDIKYLRNLLNNREKQLFEVERLIHRAEAIWKF